MHILYLEKNYCFIATINKSILVAGPVRGTRGKSRGQQCYRLDRRIDRQPPVCDSDLEIMSNFNECKQLSPIDSKCLKL